MILFSVMLYFVGYKMAKVNYLQNPEITKQELIEYFKEKEFKETLDEEMEIERQSLLGKA